MARKKDDSRITVRYHGDIFEVIFNDRQIMHEEQIRQIGALLLGWFRKIALSNSFSTSKTSNLCRAR